MRTTFRLILILFTTTILFQCSSTKTLAVNVSKTEEKHELIVFDTNFNSWLATQPSIDMYSYDFLKTKNTIFVSKYNSRVNNRLSYNANLYPQQIEYSSRGEYDKELQYTLYNYFIYFQEKYNQRL